MSFGDPVSDESFNLVQKGETAKENQNYTTITVKKTEGGKEAVALEYQYTEYPADDFSYEASITLIKQVKNYDGKAEKSDRRLLRNALHRRRPRGSTSGGARLNWH